jgi:hypothetical protein
MAERNSRRATAVRVFAFVVAAVLAVGLSLDIANHGVSLPTTIVAGGAVFYTVFSSIDTRHNRGD